MRVGVPDSSPVPVLKVAQLGCPMIEKVTVPLLAETPGWKVYVLPANTLAGGVPDSVTVGAGAVLDVVTSIIKGCKDAVVGPSVAVIVMLPVIPTSLTVGVPDSLPVAVSKLTQFGCPLMEKVTVPLLAETPGWKVYALPAATLAGGVPVSSTDGAVAPVDDKPVDKLCPPTKLLPSPEPHPARSAGMLRRTANVRRARCFRTVVMSRLQSGRVPRAIVVNKVHSGAGAFT